jgi:PAS domain S-box-containing protein
MREPTPTQETSQNVDLRQRLEQLTRENSDLRARLERVTEGFEQHVAERTIELRAASARLLAATSAANVGTWDWDIDADKLGWDDVMYRLYGLTPEQFSGASGAWRSAIHPDDARAANTAVEQALLGRAEFDVKFRIVTPSGLVRHLHAVASVHRDATGRPLKMRGVNWDISAEVIAQERLRTNEALLREFITHTPAAIAMLDRELRYVQASRRWLTDYKLHGKDIVGRSHYEVFPDIPERWKQIHQRVLAGAVESCDEDPFPREDGGMEWLQWEARPWYESSGSIGGIVFFTQVITERKLLGLRLEEQNRQLKRSNDELEQFAYVASHDLQEPLRAISGCTQILSKRYKGQLDQAADTLVEHIVDGAARMKALIDDLLRLSRSGSEQQELHAVDTAEVFRQALKNLDASIKEQGALVSAGALPIVRGDSTQLLQLFQNLLGNGLKYRRAERPEVTITACAIDGGHQFSVKDNGIGIDSRYFERVFGVFQRLHTRDEYPGTGIGLAICRKIVERHRGRIWLESSPGSGTTFHFTLRCQ